MNEGFRLDVQLATAEPRSLLFPLGTRVKIFNVGKRGRWHVEGEGVLDVHALLRFDGDSLYFKAMTPGTVFVGDDEAPTEWIELYAPCTLRLGQAQILVRRVEDASLPSGSSWLAARLHVESHPPAEPIPDYSRLAEDPDEEPTQMAMLQGQSTVDEDPTKDAKLADLMVSHEGASMAGPPRPEGAPRERWMGVVALIFVLAFAGAVFAWLLRSKEDAGKSQPAPPAATETTR